MKSYMKIPLDKWGVLMLFMAPFRGPSVSNHKTNIPIYVLWKWFRCGKIKINQKLKNNKSCDFSSKRFDIETNHFISNRNDISSDIGRQ